MRSLFISFLVLVISSSTLFANDSFLPTSFQTDFEQIFISSLSGKEKKSVGSIDYKYPGNIRFEVRGGDSTIFVSNSDKCWYYTPAFIPTEKGEVVVQKSQKHKMTRELTKFFDILKSGLKKNKSYNVEKKNKSYELTFTANVKKMLNLSKVVISFKEGLPPLLANADKIILRNDSKGDTILKLHNFNSSPSFNANHFVFLIPPNTTITEE